MQANKELLAIRKKLSHTAMDWKPTDWLDTGIPILNTVIGHADKGLAYGRMIEISGWESQGKSALVTSFAAMAQRDGAHVVWSDIENSFEPDWAIQRGMLKCPSCNNVSDKRETCKVCNGNGLDNDRITVIQPYVGTFLDENGKPEKNQRLSTAQELCSETEACMRIKRKESKQIVVIDSIAALLTEGEGAAGIENANKRLCRRWVGEAQVNNAAIFLINQLRQSPKSFGDPSYTPGGNGPKFYSHVRLRVKRPPDSKLKDGGRTAGIKGIITAVKNKTGGEEGAQVGFRLWFKGKLEFVPVKDLKED